MKNSHHKKNTSGSRSS